MIARSAFSAVLLILAFLVAAGCMHPEKADGPVQVTPVLQEPSLEVVNQTVEQHRTSEMIMLPSSTPVTTTAPLSRAATPVPLVKQPATGGYEHYTGTDYSFEYPVAWCTSVSRLPLNEYHHTMWGCSVAPAFNLDRELREYSDPDGSTFFYSSVVKTERDIWPRNPRGEVVYADIINSILGNPDSCANSPEGAFTIAGISQVPLNGVSYTGIRADFAKINATGFTDGFGKAYVVTGKEHRNIPVFPDFFRS